MPLYGVLKAEHPPIACPPHQAPRGTLLVSHCNRSVVGRPARSIAGVERIVDLAREVVESEAVEPSRVVATEELERLLLLLRSPVRGGLKGGRPEFRVEVEAIVDGDVLRQRFAVTCEPQKGPLARILVGLALLMSSNRSRINWRLVGIGIAASAPPVAPLSPPAEGP